MNIGKIIDRIKGKFSIKISYNDSYLNEDMNPEEIEKETMKMIKKDGNNKRKIKQ